MSDLTRHCFVSIELAERCLQPRYCEWDMVRNHIVMVLRLYPTKKSLVGGWWVGGRPNLMLAPGSGDRVKVTKYEPERARDSLSETE